MRNTFGGGCAVIVAVFVFGGKFLRLEHKKGVVELFDNLNSKSSSKFKFCVRYCRTTSKYFMPSCFQNINHKMIKNVTFAQASN